MYEANLHDTVYCLLFVFACLPVQSRRSDLSPPALSNQWRFQTLSPESRRQDGSVVRALDRNATPCCQYPVGARARCSPALCLSSPSVNHHFPRAQRRPEAFCLRTVMRCRLPARTRLRERHRRLSKKKIPKRFLRAVRCNCNSNEPVGKV